jgi:hypothetical protein
MAGGNLAQGVAKYLSLAAGQEFSRKFMLAYNEGFIPQGERGAVIALEITPTNIRYEFGGNEPARSVKFFEQLKNENVSIIYQRDFIWFIVAYRDVTNNNKGMSRIINFQEIFLSASNDFNANSIAETSALPGQFCKIRSNFFGKW